MISLKALVEDWVTNLPDKEIDQISPSQLGGCPRSHFLKINKVKATTPPDTGALMNFQMGFVWEGLIEKALEYAKKEGKIKDCETQVPLEHKELNLAGTADFLIFDDDELVIWDAKTMRSEWFWYLEKTNKSFLETNPNYEYQVGAYIMMAREAGYNVDKGALAFISKNDSLFGKEAVIELTDDLENRIRNKITSLQGFLDSNTLPPCECEGWKVGYCDYGNPITRERNKKGKEVNTECCSMNLWNTEMFPKEEEENGQVE